jgi:hypothetical protein
MGPLVRFRRLLVLPSIISISSLAVILFAAGREGEVFGCNVRVLLIATHDYGPTDWLTTESFLIENMLEFNGIPYDFFDITAGVLDQATLDQYDGVILEGNAMRYCTAPGELALIAANMENGSITVLLGLVHGGFDELNSTIYSAVNVSVDGLKNSENNIYLEEGASNIYDYEGDNGFVIAGGYQGKHVATAVRSLGKWTWGNSLIVMGDCRAYGFEFALETWMKNAFGVDARVTLPVISLRLDDTQTAAAPRNPELIDFIDRNKHRIRASGFLVTDGSAYQGQDSTLQNDEQIISQWGSMSLHGKVHTPVGADGEDRDFETQYNDMSIAVDFLEEHFPRYKAMKASPMNSWNVATLHAMYLNGIYYHSADMWRSYDYMALYKSLFDVDNDFDREKMYSRGYLCKLRYYPLIHSDETGEARVYSVDWQLCLSPADDLELILPRLKAHGLDWWTPVLTGSHGSTTAANNPLGWMAVKEVLMDLVDHDSYVWRRWVDTYDYAKNIQRYDENLIVNSISVSGNTVTYDISTDQAARFMTLKADKAEHRVASVTIDGTEYCYFGDDYVHLPEIDGQAVIVVSFTSGEDYYPHVAYVSPSAVVENAQYTSDKLQLTLSGEFEVTARIVGSNKVFGVGKTRVFDNNTAHLHVDASSHTEAGQVEMSLTPSAGSVEVMIDSWEVSDTGYRRWSETADTAGVWAEHVVGDLEASSSYVVMVDGSPVDTCTSNGLGQICFARCQGCSTEVFEVVGDSTSSAVAADDDATPDGARVRELFLTTHPNPSGPGTLILYGLPEPSRAILSIYSVDGSLIRTLAAGLERPGRHSTRWDGLDARGNSVSAGVYFCQLQSSRGLVTCKIVLTR